MEPRVPKVASAIVVGNNTVTTTTNVDNRIDHIVAVSRGFQKLAGSSESVLDEPVSIL